MAKSQKWENEMSQRNVPAPKEVLLQGFEGNGNELGGIEAISSQWCRKDWEALVWGSVQYPSEGKEVGVIQVVRCF